MDFARNIESWLGKKAKAGKRACVELLEACAAASDLTPDRALALVEAGNPPTAPAPLARCARYLRGPTAAALLAWADALPVSARACFAAFYQGSGAAAGASWCGCGT